MIYSEKVDILSPWELEDIELNQKKIDECVKNIMNKLKLRYCKEKKNAYIPNNLFENLNQREYQHIIELFKNKGWLIHNGIDTGNYIQFWSPESKFLPKN